MILADLRELRCWNQAWERGKQNSRTWAQIEQMIGMMQQLLQIKSADGGRQEEKSGGSGRGDANDNSGGTGRVPREEGVAGTKVGATTKTAAAGKMSSHSTRASHI